MYEEWALAVGNFAWEHRRSLGKVAAEMFRTLRGERVRVLVFGAGGVGKSTVAKLLAGKLTDEEQLRTYHASLTVERISFPGTVTGRILVAPGQPGREHTRDAVLTMLAAGKISGIINVTAYGYHSFDGIDSYKGHRAFETGMTKPRFLRAFLEYGKDEEIRQLESLIPALMGSPAKVWFMTLVTKQDLWWDKRVEVRAHYEAGHYNELIRRIQNEVSEKRFPHEIASASMTWENLRDRDHEILAATIGGYDQRIRLANLDRFRRGLEQLAGVSP